MALSRIPIRYPIALTFLQTQTKAQDILKVLLPNVGNLVVFPHDCFHGNRFQVSNAIPIFRRSLHTTSTDLECSNVDEDANPPTAWEQTAKSAEEICKLISTLPGDSNVETGLASLGDSVEVSPALVLDVLRKLSNAGVLALAFFRWAERQKGFAYTSESYNALVDSLGKIKQFKVIWAIVESMKARGVLSKDTFMLIIRRYARARKTKEAVEAFEKMETYGLKPDSSDFNRFLDTLCKSRQARKAHEVFDKMTKRSFSFTPDAKSYAILLQGWGQERDLSKLNEVYNEMKNQGFEPDAVTYGILMNAYCKVEKLDDAVKLFDEMQTKNCEPTAPIYCTLIHGFGSAKRLGEALKYFEMSKASGIAPEAPTYNTLVGSYCKCLKFDDAYKIVDEMRRSGVGPNSRTYDIILHHLITAERIDEACDTFRGMRSDHGCQPTLTTYEVMMRMFCNRGEMAKAVKLWDEMKHRGILPNMHMFSTLINKLCSEKKLEEGCRYFEEMLDVGIRPSGPLLSNLKKALLAGGKKDAYAGLCKKLDKIRIGPIDAS